MPGGPGNRIDFQHRRDGVAAAASSLGSARRIGAGLQRKGSSQIGGTDTEFRNSWIDDINARRRVGKGCAPVQALLRVRRQNRATFGEV